MLGILRLTHGSPKGRTERGNAPGHPPSIQSSSKGRTEHGDVPLHRPLTLSLSKGRTEHGNVSHHPPLTLSPSKGRTERRKAPEKGAPRWTSASRRRASAGSGAARAPAIRTSSRP